MILVEAWQLSIFIVVLSILAIVIFMITIEVIKNSRIKKMNSKVYNFLFSYAKEKDCSLEQTDLFGFNYKIEDKNKITYIKIVNNLSCYEITINSKTMWQIRKDPSDESLNMIDDIYEPMMANFDSSTKPIEKLFIIYPTARQLMMAVNECEYSFIYQATDVFGARVVTFNDLIYASEIKNIE